MNGTSAPLAVVGGGNMAQSIVRGAVDAGALDARSVTVAEPEAGPREIFRSWGIRTVRDASEVGAWLTRTETTPGDGQVLLAVKPQSFPDVARQLSPALGPGRRVIMSILAGMPTDKIREAIGEHVAVVRLMPNLPVRIRKSATAIALGAGTQEGDDQRAQEIFGAVGRVVNIDESLMDAFTAV